jgi:hypothetical protein
MDFSFKLTQLIARENVIVLKGAINSTFNILKYHCPTCHMTV